MNNNHPIQPSPALSQCQEMFKKMYAELLLFCEEAGEICYNESLWPECDSKPPGVIHRARALLAQIEPLPEPSLKAYALAQLQRIEANIPQNIKSFEASCDTIRQALEALPNE